MGNNESRILHDKEKQSKVPMFMGVFALIILCAFPLIYQDYYFNILETKYQFYCAVAIGMMVIVAGYGLYTGKVFRYFETFNISVLVKELNIVDVALIVFWIANVISWLLCKWRWEAFWGTSGRYNGVFLMTIYLVVYFMVTRFFNFKRWYLDAFLAVSIFVCIFGITDYFQMDLLGFKRQMLEEQKAEYTSTLGNINTYTVYVGLVLSISMVLFALEKQYIRSIWYFGVMLLSMVAIIIGTSDNAYLTIAALFGFSPLYLFRTKSGIRRYTIALASLLSAVLFVGWLNNTYKEQVLGIKGLFKFIIAFDHLPMVVFGLWLLSAIWCVCAYVKKGTDTTEAVGKLPVYLWIGIIIAVVTVVIYVLYDANIAGNAAAYKKYHRYIIFTDTWGSSRGYVWIRAIELYNKVFTLPQKLFGYGSDTFGLIMRQYYPPYNNLVFDSAHNEYLNFLITIGAVGMVSYIVFFASAVWKMAKNMKERPEVAAVMFAVLAYAIQATVNINLPIVMPLVLQILAMGLCKTEQK